MSDQNVHEINLSGKQLAFLFMCAVVLAAVIFMLGVSVGRDVRGTAAQQQAVQPAPGDTAVAADAPPTQTAPNDLSATQALQGRGGTSTPPPPTPSEPPPEPPASTPPPTAAPNPTPSAPPQKTAAQTPAPPTTPPAAGPSSGDGFFLQVISVSTESAGASVVKTLKGKGFPATVAAVGPENVPGRFKVQVGPYATRAEAQRAQTQLQKEGFSPFFLKR